MLICSANCERSEFNVSPFSVQYYSADELRTMLKANGFQAEVYAGFSTRLHGVAEQLRDRCRPHRSSHEVDTKDDEVESTYPNGSFSVNSRLYLSS